MYCAQRRRLREVSQERAGEEPSSLSGAPIIKVLIVCNSKTLISCKVLQRIILVIITHFVLNLESAKIRTDLRDPDYL